MKNASPYRLRDLVGVMKRLRAPDGCPWDREQTPQSLQPYLLEETHEVLEAIDRGHPDEICEELGDLLLQVVFITEIFSEQGEFSIDDVTHAITSKMIRRHPHVFEGISYESADDLKAQWEAIKREEKSTGTKSIRRGPAEVPPSLPGLMRAQKLISKKRVEADSELAQSLRKLILQEPASQQPRSQRIAAALCSLVDLAHQEGIDSEQVLRQYLNQSQQYVKTPEGKGG
ncbi:nucleoside triphosphate pyrophosphohydrolase [Geoalkalibacter subterraneus]|uniref:NTP pyrophosphohydrolase MazG-like domain-containing protein n=1 Tax=Geoalkalibacter subterraneus TaxID=483547 RepID=A0A0B5FQR0_9BACT|nr:MazG family protein [Geoalkalibacter subterraneus]AJF06440.1 hypothetical protein GSUB_07635 [Geoalkalibacter subterraneus]